jgi:cytochrome c
MKRAGLIWNEQTLFEYLAAPQAHVPGTTMLYAGLPDPQARADLIAYLRAQPVQP